MINLDGLTQFNFWFEEAILDDDVTIDSLLSRLCDKLVTLGISQSATLLATTNSPTLCLHASHSQTICALDNAHEVVYPVFSGPGPEIVAREDGLLDAFVQVLYDHRPVFVIRAGHHNVSEPLLRQVLSSLADRINLAFRFKEERRFDHVQQSLVAEFFNRSLATSQAWKVIAEFSTQFLPAFSLYTINPKPLAQVLTFKKDDKHLIMRASQSQKPGTAEYYEKLVIPLKVDETVCGIPIEQNMEYLLTNPAVEFPARYQSYLFPAQVVKSELVFPIRYGTGIIAVLNIEHPDENVFGDYCVASIRRATQSLAPFIKAVIERETKQKRKETSLLYVMTEILRRMASVYRHKIGNLLLKSRIIIDSIPKKYPEDEALKSDLDALQQFIGEFHEHSSTFLRDLPNYIKYQNISIFRAIEQAKAELDAEKLERDSGIKINLIRSEQDIFVYASQMLKEHVFNLVNNSVLAIKQRIAENKQQTGAIDINIKRVEMTDTLQKKSSPARIYVEISDNGGGVPNEIYPRIEEFGYSTRRQQGGTGYGLPAAREYVESVYGGDFLTANQFGHGFCVSFFLQEFDPVFHATVS